MDQSEIRSYQKKFKELVDFLHTHPYLEWPRGRDSGDHFLVVTMNLRQAPPKRGCTSLLAFPTRIHSLPLASSSSLTSRTATAEMQWKTSHILHP